MNKQALGLAVLGFGLMACSSESPMDDAAVSLDAFTPDVSASPDAVSVLDALESADTGADAPSEADAGIDAGSDAGSDAGPDAPETPDAGRDASCAGRCMVGSTVCEGGATRTCALDTDGCGTFGPPAACSTGLCADAAVCATVNPFEPLCTSGPEMTRAAAIAFIGPGGSSRAFGRSAVYRRQRPCNPATGCGAWGAPELVSGPALAEMVTEGTGFRIRFSEGPFAGRELTLGWTTPYADGRVNGCRWSSGLGGADSYCTLYLRVGCLRFESIYVDDTTEYAVHWSY